MNREKINKILDNLEIIENYCKKFKPDYEIKPRYTLNSTSGFVPETNGLRVDATGESIVVLDFECWVDSLYGNKGPYWIRWGRATIDISPIVIDFDKIGEEDYSDEYLKILNLIIDKINKDEFEIEISKACLK